MKKLLAICSTLLLGWTTCFAQAKKEQPAAAPDGKSLLWKISGMGLKAPSYLFGTIHMICPDDYLWTPAMQNALKRSRKIAFELDMDDPQLPMQVVAGMMLKDGKTLEDFYTEAEYKHLKEVVDHNAGMPMDMLKTLKPFAVMSMLATKSVSCTQPDSYEGNIMKIALKDKKEIVGLEAAQDQIDIFEKMNTDSTAKMLLQVADEMDELKSQFDAMVGAYKQQDLPGLYELIITSPDYKDDLNTLLFDRNRKWIPAIAQLSKAQSTFIAVGAGHLWGAEGVISLLRKAGYTVDAIK
jgi:uncharacterized protein YbaP (TraB family)